MTEFETLPNDTFESIEQKVRASVPDLVEREGGLMSGHVPMDLIDGEDVPVNSENLKLIGLQLDDESVLKGTNGQIQPIVLGLVEGEDKLYIIDGFHRYTKFADRDESKIYSTIISVTMEELLDKRIQNTRNHSGLQFARATQWVRQSWELNPYSDRIPAKSAFFLGRLKGSTGEGFGLSAEEASEIMTWVDAKAMLWGLEPMTIYGYLNTEDTVAKDLIHNSRPDPTQAQGALALNHATLKRLGKQLPNREALQRAVADKILAHRLSGTGITGLLSDIKQMNDDAALEHLSTVDFAAYKEKIAQKRVFTYPEADLVRLDKVRQSSRVRPLSEIAVATTVQIEMLLLDGEYDTAKMRLVSSDIEEVIGSLQEASKRITETIGNNPRTDKQEPHKVNRSRDEFTQAMTGFMLGLSDELSISSAHEAEMAKRAIERGRGTPEALERLKISISKYEKVHSE